jgi:L-aspartate oxidase
MAQFDAIVVGSGLAGLHAALLGARHGRILLLTKERLEDCNTMYAQGGIAAALESADSPDLHFRDTLGAGDGLCDPRAVRVLVDEGPASVRELIDLGVPFDRVNGQIVSTREAAHSYPRILHAGGDATGARIETTVVATIQATPNVIVRENHFVTELIVRDGRACGVRALDVASGETVEYTASAVILATGGAGQLFSHTTNPSVATGDGIALAFRAGAAVADVEFVQFHPTALVAPGAPRFLISEAVRGEGGVLRNAAGDRFMPRYDERAELAPRDVVARSIVFEMKRTDSPCVYLDVTHLGAERVRRRFPTIARVCAEFGIDVATQPIPVAPAAHYLMGGILTNEWGQTTRPGLYACGECACSGVHGANRLASNSLLETLVFSNRVISHVVGGSNGNASESQASSSVRRGERLDPAVVATVATAPESAESVVTLPTLRAAMWQHAGLIRDDAGLQTLLSGALKAAPRLSAVAGRADHELANLITLGQLVATAARIRTESRGAHFRADYPTRGLAWRRHVVLVSRDNPVTSWGGGPIRWGAPAGASRRATAAGVAR